MAKYYNVVLGAILAGLAVGAAAQSPLEKQLAGALGARNDKLDPDKTKRKPEWKLAHYSKTPRKGCAITYYAGEQAVSYIGPSDNINEAFVSVTSAAIPNIAKPNIIKVTLAADGEPDRIVPATHLSIAGLDQGLILFLLPNIESALVTMQDVAGVRVVLDKKPVFNLRWEGGHAARDKMRACLAGAAI